MSMYFDSMQMHVEEFLIDQVEDFDDNHLFEQPKSLFERRNSSNRKKTNLNDGFNSI